MPPGAQESQKSELRRMLDDCETLQTGFKVGIEVREAQFGRGIFLSEDVEEGTELWSNEGVRMFRSRDELLTVLEGAAPEDVATLFDHLYVHVWLPSVGCHTCRTAVAANATAAAHVPKPLREDCSRRRPCLRQVRRGGRYGAVHGPDDLYEPRQG